MYRQTHVHPASQLLLPSCCSPAAASTIPLQPLAHLRHIRHPPKHVFVVAPEGVREQEDDLQPWERRQQEGGRAAVEVLVKRGGGEGMACCEAL